MVNLSSHYILLLNTVVQMTYIQGKNVFVYFKSQMSLSDSAGTVLFHLLVELYKRESR